jgi:hypothetical protein
MKISFFATFFFPYCDFKFLLITERVLTWNSEVLIAFINQYIPEDLFFFVFEEGYFYRYTGRGACMGTRRSRFRPVGHVEPAHLQRPA